MELATIANPIPQSAPKSKPRREDALTKVQSQTTDALEFELGLWLSGLESFLSAGNHPFAEKTVTRARDWNKEFRLTHSALLLCSKLIFRLSANARKGETTVIDSSGLADLSEALKDSILLSESLIRAEPLKFGEWKAWCSMLSEKLKSVNAFEKMISNSEVAAENSLPRKLVELMAGRPIPFSEKADLQHILPRFAKILKSLSVVERMLANDEPLKHSLLIFARVHEQTQELVGYINNRLTRFPNEDAELFRSLDSASYTASIELRKVYDQELTGLVAIRPTLSIYARIETACALLSDSFQQILAGFARLIDPAIEASAIFPNFNAKLDRSIKLRHELWQITKTIKSCETHPEAKALSEMNKKLKSFLDETVHFLYYKDKESVERFVEEIFVTKDNKDLVPILHRFGAYLETLFGQVNNRTVLSNHPFEIK